MHILSTIPIFNVFFSYSPVLYTTSQRQRVLSFSTYQHMFTIVYVWVSVFIFWSSDPCVGPHTFFRAVALPWADKIRSYQHRPYRNPATYMAVFIELLITIYLSSLVFCLITNNSRHDQCRQTNEARRILRGEYWAKHFWLFCCFLTQVELDPHGRVEQFREHMQH